MGRLSERFMYYCGLLATITYVDDLKHIQNLIDAEEQGLLLRLPCKVGTKVYYVQKCQAPYCKKCFGFKRIGNCYYEYKSRIFEHEFDYRYISEFGKTVFLTREEAEQALAEMQKG